MLWHIPATRHSKHGDQPWLELVHNAVDGWGGKTASLRVALLPTVQVASQLLQATAACHSKCYWYLKWQSQCQRQPERSKPHHGMVMHHPAAALMLARWVVSGSFLQGGSAPEILPQADCIIL